MRHVTTVSNHIQNKKMFADATINDVMMPTTRQKWWLKLLGNGHDPVMKETMNLVADVVAAKMVSGWLMIIRMTRDLEQGPSHLFLQRCWKPLVWCATHLTLCDLFGSIVDRCSGAMSIVKMVHGVAIWWNTSNTSIRWYVISHFFYDKTLRTGESMNVLGT